MKNIVYFDKSKNKKKRKLLLEKKNIKQKNFINKNIYQ